MDSITVRDFTKIVEFNIRHNIKRPLMGLGAPGIGKSESMHAICEKYGMKYVDMRLLLFSETELKGVPFPDEGTGTTKWFPNHILPRVESDGERGLLLIEELTSAPKKVQAAAYQLLQDRRLGEYEVPEGWFIVGLGNGEDDDGVFVQMPSPLANRMQIQNIRPDLTIWKEDFAFQHGISEKVVAYLTFKPAALHTQVPGESSQLFGSPRSWTAVSDIINTGESLEDPLIRMQIEGNIGDVEASSFYSFLKYEDQLPDILSILSGKLKTPPEDNSLKYLLISSLVSHFSFLIEGRERPVDWENELLNTVEYFCNMPAEFFALSLKDLISLNRKELKRFLLGEFDSPEITDFVKENKYLFD